MRIIPILIVVFAAPSARADEPTYWQDIRPVLRKNCTVCHNAKNLKEFDVSGGLALDTIDLHPAADYVCIGTELPAAFDRTEQPLYRLLWPFYEHGMYAVPLFFVLSGFVFFHLYAEAVRTGGVVAYEFFVLRLSRLYPLHVATLLLVLIGQAVAKALNGDFLVAVSFG